LILLSDVASPSDGRSSRMKSGKLPLNILTYVVIKSKLLTMLQVDGPTWPHIVTETGLFPFALPCSVATRHFPVNCSIR
jgi:hypothetical protein